MTDIKYEKLLIGRGTVADVYKLIGHQPPAVVKYCRKVSDENSFREEYRVLGLLKHPNVVCLLGAIDDNRLGVELNGIKMEYCQRGMLRDWISNASLIYSMRTVLEWAEELFGGLRYVFEEHQLVHRDIKPENIFVTNDFHLKIGDFGRVKQMEHTMELSCQGTLRYMSPPPFAKEKDYLEELKKEKDSHRNDVYSMGLVLWEIIERRVVFSKYGQLGEFNRETFLFDVFTNQLSELIAPKCEKTTQDLIQRSTRFNHRSRPTAESILSDIVKIKKDLDGFFSKLTFHPIIEIESQKPFRPIGFDGTEEKISIDLTTDEEQKETSEAKLTERFDQKSEIWDWKALWKQELMDDLKEAFTSLAKLKKEKFLEKVPEILKKTKEKTRTIDEWREIFEAKLYGYPFEWEVIKPMGAQEREKFYEDHRNEKTSKPAKDLDIEELFELFILKDFDEEQNVILESLMNYWRDSSNNPWVDYSRGKSDLKLMETFQQFNFTTCFIFEFYILPRTGEEWIRLEKNNFVSESFMNFKEGEKIGPLWLFTNSEPSSENRNNQTHRGVPHKEDIEYLSYIDLMNFKEKIERKAKGKKIEQNSKERKDQSHKEALYYSHTKSMEFSFWIDIMKKGVKKCVKMAKIQQERFVPIEDSKRNNLAGDFSVVEAVSWITPIVVFQLRNPPRHICEHEPKCPLKGFDPYEDLFNGSSLIFSRKKFDQNELQIPIYSCTSDEALGCLRTFLSATYRCFDCFLTPFWFRNFGGYFFLNFRNRSGDFFLLLDHPSNYQEGEMIPFASFDGKIFFEQKEIVDEYLDRVKKSKITYTLIVMLNKENWDFYNLAKARWPSVQIFSSNGQPLTDRFELKKGLPNEVKKKIENLS